MARRSAVPCASRRWGVLVFGLGLYVVTWTSSRDKAAKARGELVDAWWNQSTRRWEKPLPHMFKDPLLSSLIHLKPPNMVHAASSAEAMARASARRKQQSQATTLDGVKLKDAYRQRQEGSRR